MDDLDQLKSPILTMKPGKDRSIVVIISISVFMILILIGLGIFFMRNINQSTQATSIDLLPMYGGIQKNLAQLQADQVFINDTIKSGVDKQTASAGIAQGAWQFAHQGNIQTAMKRFNEAWLLDQNNWDVYKGYVNIIPPSKYNDLYIYAEKVLAQNPNSATLQCLLGVIHNNMFLTSTDKNVDYLNQGESEFQKGLAIDVNNPFCQLNFAVNLNHNGKYQEAWDHLVTNSILPYSRYDNKLTLDIYAKNPVLNSAEAYNLIEFTYQRLGQTDNAFTLLQNGVSLYPKNVPLACDLGGVYITKWYSAEQANPNVSNTFLKQAEKYLETGIQLDPQSASCQGKYAVAIYYDKSKDLKSVWPQVKKAEALGWVFDQKFLTNLQAVSP